MNDVVPPPPPLLSSPPSVLSYETAQGASRRRRWPRVAMWIFAVLSLLGGLGQAGGAGTLVAEMLNAGGSTEALFWAPMMAVAAVAGTLGTMAALLLIARRAPWHVPIMFAVATAVTVLVGLAMMGLCVAYRHATGWDTLAVAIGMIFAAAATALAWTYAATAALAVRVGRADDARPPTGTRALSRALIVITAVPLVAGLVAYLLYLYLP